MTPDRSYPSPNHGEPLKQVEFAVIHYTACAFDDALELLTAKASKVSAHLLIDEQGRTFELVPCWDGEAACAWHAGRSRYEVGGKIWEEFNNFSIGIEIVNLNGNVFAYGERQYQALITVLRHLIAFYPNLNEPGRIIGHEQIAGFRGKCDPGVQFDWNRVLKELFPGRAFSAPSPMISPSMVADLERLFSAVPGKQKSFSKYCSSVNALLESLLGKR
ncbi:MAG: N-acetylmuramoyl-L-alanine amidase [Oligoflexia bacterium]|nr:N-acetylmuramoyl-L-alanine amidase [Oligoflexia bacterium]